MKKKSETISSISPIYATAFLMFSTGIERDK